MDQQIINVLDDLSARFGVVIDWTSDNVLPYLEDLYSRLVKYLWLTKIFEIIMFAIILFISAVYIYKFIKKISIIPSERDSNAFWYDNYYNEMSTMAIIIMTVVIGSFFIAALIMISLVQEIIGLCTIPEAEVLNYITNNYL